MACMVSSPHDALFKVVFERPEEARGELQSLLPRPLAQALDWSTLALVPGDFRDPDLADYHTDLLFSARVRDGGRALIYLLFEHQSTSDPHMAFRLLRYLVRIWESWRNEHGHSRPLPVIIPLVFYHGARPWSAPLSFESMIEMPGGLDELMRPYVPSFRYLVDDVSRLPDEELRQRTLTALALLAVVCLRDLRDRYVLEAMTPWVEDWVDVMRPPQASDDVRPLVRYLYEVKGAEEVNVFLRFLERDVGPEAKELMRTYAEELIQQGQIAGERRVLLKLLRQRFGPLDAATEQRIAIGTSEQLEIWSTRVLSAATLPEILAD